MKNFLKIFIGLVIFAIILGTIFYMVDTARVHNDCEPIFTFVHKVIDGIDYSAQIDTGFGYKIIRTETSDKQKNIKVGTIFMKEEMPNNVIESGDSILTSGDAVSSGENELPKQTTFGDSYEDFITLEGMEEKVYAKRLNSKLGYSMTYYHDLFEYVGFEDHDLYKWTYISGDLQPTMTIYDVSDQKVYDEAMKKINKDKALEEISGESMILEKAYSKTYTENDVHKVQYFYIINLENLKLMLDLSYPVETGEGVGVYMSNMINSITKS